MEARYKATNQILNKSNIHQILEIASGLSPRGLALTENPEITYVATDLPEIVEQGKSIVNNILAQTNSSRPNLHYQAVNALDSKDLLAATTFFKLDNSIAVISEGLFTYLNKEEKSTVAANILKILKKNGGVWITSDVTTTQFIKKIIQTSEELKEIAARVFKNIGLNIENSVLDEEIDIQEFFREAGFTIEEYYHSGLIDKLSSMKMLNIDRKTVAEMLNGRKTLILAPS